ncbi:MAG: hypothetical protein PHX87_01750 [Candidatus Peribacteraceae bacterium]|nr:hypothetical protein [Candidatus Peribacteraceae bacterium]MDD5742132.1 hypothetical protein [Candidatus Peribacteraceae bacterium]
MGISLKRLEKKKLDLGINKLSNAGIDVEWWLAMCDADAAAMHRLVAAWPVRLPSFVHDAKTTCGILGFPNNCKKEAPKAGNGEIVVWYDSWTLGELVATGKVVNYLSKKRESWKAPPGYYHARIPVPDSNRMTPEQHADLLARLYASLKELPTPVGATVLAVHLGVTGENLLEGYFCACAQVLPRGIRAALDVEGGRVRVGFWNGHRSDGVFLGAARKS